MLIPKDICLWVFVPILLSFITGILLVLSLFFIAFASFPRTTGPEGSNIFFGAIASKELSDFKVQILKQTEEEYIEDLIDQCHRNAQIADRKYFWVKKSIICIFLSMPFWTVSVFLLFSLGK